MEFAALRAEITRRVEGGEPLDLGSLHPLLHRYLSTFPRVSEKAPGARLVTERWECAGLCVWIEVYLPLHFHADPSFRSTLGEIHLAAHDVQESWAYTEGNLAIDIMVTRERTVHLGRVRDEIDRLVGSHRSIGQKSLQFLLQSYVKTLSLTSTGRVLTEHWMCGDKGVWVDVWVVDEDIGYPIIRFTSTKDYLEFKGHMVEESWTYGEGIVEVSITVAKKI
jgi:hypothetical protein